MALHARCLPKGEPHPKLYQLIRAPERPAVLGQRTIFVAGNTSGTDKADWRATLVGLLAHLPVTIIDPTRADWDASWREDAAFAPFHEQVRWELEMQDRADVVVVHFGASSKAPISLLELGLRAGSGRKCRVVCENGYWKRGNVVLVCERYGIAISDSVDALARELINDDLSALQ